MKIENNIYHRICVFVNNIEKNKYNLPHMYTYEI